MSRRFSRTQRKILHHLSGGVCAICGRSLGRKWHADHIQAYSKGGLTVIKNGQALCVKCNLRKGANDVMSWVRPLRRWQANAAAQIINAIDAGKKSFTLVSFPGAGKTTLALRVIYDWLKSGERRFVIVVVPSTNLKRQFRKDADEVGLNISAKYKNGSDIPAGAQGIVVTYAQLDSDVEVFESLCVRHNVLVILDECHHVAGEDLRGESKAWGDAVQLSFSRAQFVLLMSGTLWRSDQHSIPFVRYADGIAVPDFMYTYSDVLSDTSFARRSQDRANQIARQVMFVTMGGEAEYYHDLEMHRVTLDESLGKQQVSPALRTVLDANVGVWFRHWFAKADEMLLSIRRDKEHPYSDAAGLVIGYTSKHAELYADIIKEMTGEEPYLVHYKGDDPSDLIERFKTQQDKNGNPVKTPRWIVSVNMISEGVDIPRLCVLFYATIVRERLYFYQAIGRVIRWHRDGAAQQTGYVYIPFVKPLTDYAEEIKQIIVHMLDSNEHVGGKDGGRDYPSQEKLFAAQDSIDAIGDVIFADERTEAQWIEMAASLMEEYEPLANLGTREFGGMLLKKLAESGKITFVSNSGSSTSQEVSPAPDASVSRGTWEDEIDKEKELVKHLIQEVRSRFFADEPKEYTGTIYRAINAYLNNNLGFGARDSWGVRTNEVVKIIQKWLYEERIPHDLRSKYQYLKRQG